MTEHAEAEGIRPLGLQSKLFEVLAHMFSTQSYHLHTTHTRTHHTTDDRVRPGLTECTRASACLGCHVRTAPYAERPEVRAPLQQHLHASIGHKLQPMQLSSPHLHRANGCERECTSARALSGSLCAYRGAKGDAQTAQVLVQQPCTHPAAGELQLAPDVGRPYGLWGRVCGVSKSPPRSAGKCEAYAVP